MTRMITKYTVYSTAGCHMGQSVRAMVKNI